MSSTVGFLVTASVLFLVLAFRSRESRLDAFVLGDDEAQASPVDSTKKRTLGLTDVIQKRVRDAGLSLSAQQFVILSAFTTATGVVLGSAVPVAIGPVLGLAAGIAGPWVYLGRMRDRRLEAFRRAFGQMLSSMSSSLRAGASLEQALERAAGEAPEPLATALREAVRAVDLGKTPAQAVLELRRAADLTEVTLFVVATEILSRTGGDLPRIYDVIADMLSEQRTFRQALRAYTSQARLSATIVSLIPIGLTFLLRALNPNYFRPMEANVLGRAVMFLCYTMIAVGWVIVRKMLELPAN